MELGKKTTLKTLSRFFGKLISGVVIIGILLWLVDATIAARAERNISQAVATSANLESSPQVFAGGPIFTAALFTGELGTISVDVLDVEVAGLGMINARSEATSVSVTPKQVWTGDIIGARAELYTRSLRLDGVALGTQLNITDLDISHPLNISPSGGMSSEALLTGTPAGFSEPISVLVTLRLIGSEFHMTPIKLVDAPSDTTLSEVAKSFSWSVDTLDLPLADRASAVYLSGGSIYFQSEARNIELSIDDLSPLATSAPE